MALVSFSPFSQEYLDPFVEMEPLYGRPYAQEYGIPWENGDSGP